MLYVTTRNKDDVFTSFHTLTKDRCEYGGLYVPFQLTAFSSAELAEFKEKSIGQCIADILNLFFSARLDGLDVDFCIGKNTLKLTPMGHKIVVVESWHNSERDFSYVVEKLYTRVQNQQISERSPSNWTNIAVRIALLFALYGELLRCGHVDLEQTFDVAVAAGDFSAPMAAWYARRMGLPIGNIVCGCKDNDALWNLFHHRQLTMDKTVPSNLEQLIFATLGADETIKYGKALEASRVYEPNEEQCETLRDGMYAAVVSKKRTQDVIGNVYRSTSYLLESNSSAAYAGLQDYRASTGEGRIALILTEQCPVCDCAAVSSATGLSEHDIKLMYG